MGYDFFDSTHHHKDCAPHKESMSTARTTPCAKSRCPLAPQAARSVWRHRPPVQSRHSSIAPGHSHSLLNVQFKQCPHSQPVVSFRALPLRFIEPPTAALPAKTSIRWIHVELTPDGIHVSSKGLATMAAKRSPRALHVLAINHRSFAYS